ncbi:MAG TPA: hypothetical protein PJ988_05100 [Anaerolinea sp.]|nr:hypothetical protein [Anaerolinea sp.]
MGHKRTHFFIRLALLIFLVVGVLFQPLRPAQAAGARYYVRGNGGSDGNSGTSWAQAYKNLQKALAVAANGDEIWVAAGVYYPDNGGPYPPARRREGLRRFCRHGNKPFGAYYCREPHHFERRCG